MSTAGKFDELYASAGKSTSLAKRRIIWAAMLVTVSAFVLQRAIAGVEDANPYQNIQ